MERPGPAPWGPGFQIVREIDVQRLLKGLSPEGEALLDLIPGGVMQCRNDGNYTIVDVNEGFRGMFGFTAEELTQRFQNQFLAMIHPADRQNFLIEVDRQLGRGDRLSLSYRVVCKDGGYKWTASSAKLFGDEREERFSVSFSISPRCGTPRKS